jgi:hypothetical protein
MMPSLTRLQSARGMSLIEVLLGISLVTIIVVSISSYYGRALLTSLLTTQRIQSSFLIEEGMNVLKMFRNAGWNTNIKNLSTTTTYYLSWNGTTWSATSSPQWVENTFLRSFVVRDVFRDGTTDDIVSSGGVFSTTTKKLIITVSWPFRTGTTTDVAETYITNLFSN